MSTSRRDFLRKGAFCALSLGLSLSITDLALGQRRADPLINSKGFPVPFESQQEAVFHFSRATFDPYVGTTFVIDPGYTFPFEGVLVEVKDLRSAEDKKRNVPGKECFSLTFRVHNENRVKQGTYQIQHGALGTFELFIAPLKDRSEKRFFEAIINHMAP